MIKSGDMKHNESYGVVVRATNKIKLSFSETSKSG